MCLYEVTKTEKNCKELKKTVWAWKVFGKTGKTLYGQHFYGVTFPKGKWKKAKELYIEVGKGDYDTVNDVFIHPHYKTGFHAYKHRKDAREMTTFSEITRKVKLRGVHTYGNQCGRKVLVAREILVPKKGKSGG